MEESGTKVKANSILQFLIFEFFSYLYKGKMDRNSVELQFLMRKLFYSG